MKIHAMMRIRMFSSIGLLSLLLHISVGLAAPAPSAVAPVTCPAAESVAYTRAGCPCLILSRPADRPPLGYCPVGQRCSTSALDTMQKNHGLFADLPRAPKDYVHGMCLPCMLGEGHSRPEGQQLGRAAASRWPCPEQQLLSWAAFTTPIHAGNLLQVAAACIACTLLYIGTRCLH